MVSTPPGSVPSTQQLIDGLKAVQSGTQWKALCPAHNDANPSLSIRDDNGTPLLHCFAGCSQQAVLDALRVRDLWPSVGTHRATRAAARTVTKHRYIDASGITVAIHERTEELGKEKKMRWRRPDGKFTLGGTPVSALPLYRLPDVLAAPSDATVLIVEGEKAADAAHAAGFVSTTLAGGVSPLDYSIPLNPLAGRRVVLWPDNDAQGRAHMDRIAAALSGIAAEVRQIEPPGLPSKGDAADYFAAGRTRAELEDLIAAAPPLPSSDSTPSSAAQPAQVQPPTLTIPDLARRVSERLHVAQDASQALYVFRDGVYQPNAERAVSAALRDILRDLGAEKLWSSFRVSEVCEYLRIDAPVLWASPPMDTLNVKNGLLDIATRQLRPHDPGFLSLVQLPVSYDPAAKCRAWEEFVSDVLPQDAAAAGTVWEIAAWLMVPMQKLQKSLLLLGEGSNGKSTLLRALMAFLGRPNVANLSLHKLEEDRFSAVRLLGKLANICPDLPSAHLVGTSTFKAITGGDPILAERKFQGSFEFVPFARLIFSANQPPRSDDATFAFFRRWGVIPFEKTFASPADRAHLEALQDSSASPDEVKPAKDGDALDARLADPVELSGVLNKALDALPRVRATGLTETPSMRAAWNEFRATTDPLAVWLDRNTVEGAEILVPKEKVLAAYNHACQRTGRSPMTGNAFGRAFRRLRPHIKDAQRTYDGRLQWCWVGISLDKRSRNSRDSRESPLLKSIPGLLGDSPRARDAGGSDSGRSNDESPTPRTENGLSRENPVNAVNPVNRADGGGTGAPDKNTDSPTPFAVGNRVHPVIQDVEQSAGTVTELHERDGAWWFMVETDDGSRTGFRAEQLRASCEQCGQKPATTAVRPGLLLCADCVARYPAATDVGNEQDDAAS